MSVAPVPPSPDGVVAAVQKWVRAVGNLKQAKRALTSAECELTNTVNDLGKRLVPSDAKTGETFYIWYGDGLLAVTKEPAEYKVEWRKAPKDLNWEHT